MKPSKRSILKFLIITLIPLVIGLYFRLYPLRKHQSNDASEKAAVYVINQIQRQVDVQVKKNYSHLNQVEQDVLRKKFFNEIFKKDKDNIRKTMDQFANQLDQEAGAETYPFLLASDSYYYYDLTNSIVQTGSIARKKIGSKYLNEKMLAPVGHLEPMNLHPYVGYYLYRVIQLFDPDISLMKAVSFTPLVIIVFCMVSFVIANSLLNISSISTITSSIFFILSPILLKRSMFGWYDNDPYNALFPFLLLAYVFYLLDKSSKESVPKKHLILFPILLCTYSLFWHGWGLFFAILVTSLIGLLIINFIFFKNKSYGKELFKSSASFIIVTLIGISFLFGFKEFFILFKEGWIALKNFLVPQLSLWPDLYISVGELHKASYDKIITLIGSYFFFILAILGITIEIIISFIKRNIPRFSKAFVLITMLISTLIIAKGAQRFAMLTLVPLSLGFSYALNIIYMSLKRITENIKLPNIASQVIPIVLAALILLISVPAIKATEKNTPALLDHLYNETWNEALTYIKDHTPENSVVNAWWPPGHFIKAMANRRVTFDGASINYPQAYWMANVFMNQNEQEAVGILKMLNVSANQASDNLFDQGVPLSKATSLLKKIVTLNKNKASVLLTKLLKDTQKADDLLALTHKAAPPSYILIYRDFVESNLQLKFFGGWNFKAIEDLNADPSKLTQVPERNSSEYIDYLWELAGGPYRYSGPLGIVSKNNSTLLFQNNIRVDMKTKECFINSEKFGKGVPLNLIYVENDKVIKKSFDNANLTYSVILTNNTTSPQIVLLDPRLADTMLMRMYYLKAKDLKYINHISHHEDLTHRTIIDIYEVDIKKFEGDLKN